MVQKIPANVQSFLNSQKLGYVATVSENNMPNLSPKGTIIVWDEETVVFADIRSPNTLKNLEKNPNLEINVIDPLIRRGYRISGTGSIVRNGKNFDAILKYYGEIGIKSPINAIVLVKIENIASVTSPLYDLGASEFELKEKWKKYFNES